MSNVVGATDQKRPEVATIFASSGFLSFPFYSGNNGGDRNAIRLWPPLSEIQELQVSLLRLASSWFAQGTVWARQVSFQSISVLPGCCGF